MRPLLSRSFLLLAALAAALVAIAPVARAQNALDSLIREGVAHNLALAQQQLTGQQARLDVTRARALYLPSVALDAKYTQVSGGLNLGDLINPAYAALNQLTGTDQFPTNISLVLPFKQDTRLRLIQPVYDGQILAANAFARAAHEVELGKTGAATRDVAAGVQLAWLQHAAAGQVVSVFQSTLALIDENLRVNEKLVAAGKATPEVVYRARADRSEAIQRLAEAGQRRDAAARAFDQVMGRPLDTPVPALPDSLFVLPLDLARDDAVRGALAERDELREADGGIHVAEAKEQLARAAFAPTLALAVDYGFQGNQLEFNANSAFASLTVAVGWQLFAGGRDATRKEQAKLEATSAELARADLVRRITEQVQQSYDAAAIAFTAITTSTDRLTAARRTYELVSKRYDAGVAAPLELTDARTEFTNAALNAVLTRYSYATRRVELQRAAALWSPNSTTEGSQP